MSISIFSTSLRSLSHINGDRILRLDGGFYVFDKVSERRRVAKLLKRGLSFKEALNYKEPEPEPEPKPEPIVEECESPQQAETSTETVDVSALKSHFARKGKVNVKQQRMNDAAADYEKEYDELDTNPNLLELINKLEDISFAHRKYDFINKVKSKAVRWMLRWYLYNYSYQNDRSKLEKELLSDWAAFKDIKHFLIKNEERYGKYNDLYNYYVYFTDHTSAYSLAKDLLKVGVRFAWQAEATLDLLKECYNRNRSWGSCYQVNIHKVFLVACCPDLKKLSLKLKKAIVHSGFHFPKERLGSYHELKKAARVWVVAPNLPKKLALKVYKLQDTMKFRLAQVAYNPFESVEQFWVRFNNLLKLRNRKEKAKLLYKAGYRKVAISMIHQNMSEATELALKNHYKEMSVQEDFEFINIKVKALNEISEANPCYDYGWMNIRLAYTFGNNWKAWVSKNEDVNLTLHDYTFFLPNKGEVKGLDSFLLKNADRHIKDLEIVCENWETMTPEDKQMNFKELIAKLKSYVYPKAKSKDFAIESAKYGISKDAYNNYENRYLAAQALNDFHPEVKISKEGYTGQFLRRSDVRGVYLGNYTNCCQHPNGVGKACAWYGLENPNSGFFVVTDKQGEILAQSWVWSTQEGICFDNVEAKGLGVRGALVGSIYKEAANQLSQQYQWVTMGLGLGDLYCVSDISMKDLSHTLSLPTDYSGYSDAAKQSVLAYNPTVTVGVKPTVWVSGMTQDDFESMTAVAQAVYPEGWQFAGSEETDYGFKLVKEDVMIGYCTIESANKYISDIAVLEEHRKYSIKLIDRVLDYCKAVGGKWSADCRVKTSYRLLQAYQRRGKVSIIEVSDSSTSMDNDVMKNVVFEVI